MPTPSDLNAQSAAQSAAQSQSQSPLQVPAQAPVSTPALPGSPFSAGIALADLGFAWPAPDLPGYPQAVKLALVPCQVEGLNGALTSGRLVDVQADKSQIHIVARGARSAVTLHFNQFVHLRLAEELHRQATADAAALPVFRYRLHMKRGDVRYGDVVAHVELGGGLFLFEPADTTSGRLRRSFVPRSAYLHFDRSKTQAGSHAWSECVPPATGSEGIGHFNPSSPNSQGKRSGHSSDMASTISGVRLQPGLISMAQMARQLHAVAQQAHAQGVAAAVIEQCRRSAAKERP